MWVPVHGRWLISRNKSNGTDESLCRFCLLQDLFLLFQKLVAQDHGFRLLKSDAVDGIRETFTGNAFGAEEEDGFFHNIQNFFLAGDDLAEHLTLIGTLAPTATDVDLVTGDEFIIAMEGALANAAATLVAESGIDGNFTVFYLCGFHRTESFDLALLTTLAEVGVELRNLCADNAQVIDVGLDTIMRTAAHGDLKFMRKLYGVIADVKALVDLFRKSKGVNQTKVAGRTLAGHHGANARTRSSRLQAVLGKKIAKSFDFFFASVF